ncbi:flagellar type III secretion system pore protein FliP [Fusibacter paucivorans]|uniref:Flagellar biosynthetic protein FliP n=2 Tax=Fusibacter paucivorans TaxID=76009 RepID=A0ABS5PTA3_9FIRM|nr:flagellar type III secretion system pore protein FliP [Fusibacter paucivorans]
MMQIISKVPKRRTVAVIVAVIAVWAIFSGLSFGETSISLPEINVSINNGDGDVQIANSIQLMILLTILSLAPSILIMMTCFTRYIIVLGFVRRALSLQSTPPNQVLIGLALFLTFFTMSSVFTEVYEDAYLPFQEGTVTIQEAADLASEPVKEFMLKQVRTRDLSLFMGIAGITEIETNDDIPLRVVIPAFIISELKIAFEIGFLIFIPFIVVDMIVASTLMALGMMMLPPVMISLPIKVLLFLMVDGWHLIVEKLIMSIR